MISLTWVCFFLLISTSPFLAIWEMVWKKFSNKEEKMFSSSRQCGGTLNGSDRPSI
jgi:hypothetical protein